MRLHRDLLDRGFDRRQGLRTSGIQFQKDLDLSGDNAQFAMEYEPSPELVFRRMMASLHIDFERFVFIDLGSGKGRVLALAAEFPFARVEGVELSPRMNEISVRNVRAMGERGSRVICRHLDATAYEFPSEPFVIFAFNPFRGPVLARVLANLERSLTRIPREGYILYLNARHRDIVDASSMFVPLARSSLEKVFDRVLSPWPLALYKTRRPCQN